MNKPPRKYKRPLRPFWVTVYTDASFKDGVGAWACWIRSGKGRIVESGVCPRSVMTSNQAEFYAVLKALEIIKEQLPRTRGLYLNADSKLVVDKIPLNAPAINGASRNQQKACHEILRDTKWGLQVRHIRSHQKIKDSKTFINNQVDELAKQALALGTPPNIFYKSWSYLVKKWYQIKKKLQNSR